MTQPPKDLPIGDALYPDPLGMACALAQGGDLRNALVWLQRAANVETIPVDDVLQAAEDCEKGLTSHYGGAPSQEWMKALTEFCTELRGRKRPPPVSAPPVAPSTGAGASQNEAKKVLERYRRWQKANGGKPYHLVGEFSVTFSKGDQQTIKIVGDPQAWESIRSKFEPCCRTVRVAPPGAGRRRSGMRHLPSLLIEGKPGTGKDTAAHLVLKFAHFKAKNPPFIVTVCGGLKDVNLAKSELFGHKKGAFTGADTDRTGAFKMADGGVLVLQDVWKLHNEVQPLLLRALEEGKFKPLGADAETDVSILVVSTSNEPLKDKAQQDEFQQDLYQRLRRGWVVIPPLNDRRADIAHLAAFFAEQLAAEEDQPIEIDEAALLALIAADWTDGNTRTLRDTIDAAIGSALSNGRQEILLDDLPEEVRKSAGSTTAPTQGEDEAQSLLRFLLKCGSAGKAHSQVTKGESPYRGKSPTNFNRTYNKVWRERCRTKAAGKPSSPWNVHKRAVESISARKGPAECQRLAEAPWSEILDALKAVIPQRDPGRRFVH